MRGQHLCLALGVLSLATLVLACSPDAEEPQRPPPGTPLVQLPAEIQILPRGHQEVRIETDGSLTPLWLGRKQKVGLCLEPPLQQDSSQWSLAITVNGQGKDQPVFLRPSHYAGTTLCFSQFLPEDLADSDTLHLCAELWDRYDDKRFRIPCLDALWEPDASSFAQSLSQGRELISRAAELPLQDLLTELDDLARATEERGFPVLAQRFRLVAVHMLRRQKSEQHLLEAQLRLSRLPDVLQQPETSVQLATIDYEKARVADALGQTRQAWAFLDRAEQVARRVAAVERLAIVMHQTEILRRQGRVEEPIARLAHLLEECERQPCERRLHGEAHGLLAWFLLDTPDPEPTALDAAQRHLEAEAELGRSDPSPEGEANWWINRALLDRLRGQDPTASLKQARTLLDGLPKQTSGETGQTAADKLSWADAVQGLAALDQGRLHSALQQCQQAAGLARSPRVAARAWSCTGQTLRRLSRLEEAAEALATALVQHRQVLAQPELSPRSSPGQHSDDLYRSARLAVERGRAEEAWQLLQAQDLLAATADPSCAQRSTAPGAELALRRQQLEMQLSWTEPPLSKPRQQQLASTRRILLQALDQVHQQLLSRCDQAFQAPATASFRAFALPDEIVLLFRDRGGAVRTRRTPFARRELRHLLQNLRLAQSEGRMADEQWRRLIAPLVPALAPSDLVTAASSQDDGSGSRGKDDPPQVYFALHGILQQVPLAALPLEADQGWLADRLTATLRPALIRRPPAASTTHGGEPLADGDAALFVVDPRRNLASGHAAARSYRTLFPRALVLHGDDAQRQRIEEALRTATWLHFDAHGRHDAAYPSLSGLQMHDGTLTAADLAQGTTRQLVNLSGCQTGWASPAGDSSPRGLAGSLAMHGARWVIASQSTVSDQLLADYNRFLYEDLSKGVEVPAAHAAAHAAVRRSYPAAAWANLQLIGAPPGPQTEKRSQLSGSKDTDTGL